MERKNFSEVFKGANPLGKIIYLIISRIHQFFTLRQSKIYLNVSHTLFSNRSTRENT